MAADQLWKIKVDGKEYELRTEDLTVGNLRHCKQWFGAAYGRYLPFIQMLIEGDCDAIACAVWMARRAAGERNVMEPSQMGDFVVSDFFTVIQEDDEDESEPDPTEASPTSDSQPTSEGSDSDTSSTSSTSEG